MSLNLFYRSQKPKKNYCTGDKPRGASPGREDGISTNNLVSYNFMVFSREILKKGGSAPRATD